MVKDTRLTSFGKWVATINSEILQDKKNTTAAFDRSLSCFYFWKHSCSSQRTAKHHAIVDSCYEASVI